MPDNSVVKQVYNDLFKLHEMGFLTWVTWVGKLIDTYSINTDKYCHPVFRLVSYLGLDYTDGRLGYIQRFTTFHYIHQKKCMFLWYGYRRRVQKDWNIFLHTLLQW